METELAVAPIDKRTRIPERVIRAMAQMIADEFHPQQIILFGSYAYGKPDPESDVDLLVIMDTPKRPINQALEIRQYINPLFGVDFLVYTPAVLEQRLQWGDSFLREILERGVVLYESSDA